MTGVYLEALPRLPSALEGRMMMLPAAHGQRYVRIQIVPRGTPDESVAVLGHELPHAIEVAEETGVNTEARLIELYQRMGRRSGRHVYDTVAAQDIGRAIGRELLA